MKVESILHLIHIIFKTAMIRNIRLKSLSTLFTVIVTFVCLHTVYGIVK